MSGEKNPSATPDSGPEPNGCARPGARNAPLGTHGPWATWPTTTATSATGRREMRNAQSAWRRATDAGAAPARASTATLPEVDSGERNVFDWAGDMAGSYRAMLRSGTA